MTASAPAIDAVLAALGNPTRRAVVERLSLGAATVSDLAAPFDMALPSLLQHVQVLERSGVVASTKRGRVRTVRLVPERLALASHWLEQQRRSWEQRLDQLDAFLTRPEE